jgi:metal-responsive CopG/Arc/MetJ family transcriptional regulator
MAGYKSAGLSLDDRLWDQLDEVADRWDDQGAGVVGRSEVAREAIPLGLDAIRIMDGYAGGRTLSYRERQGRLRQALHSYEADETDAEAVLVERLAEEAGVDADALRAKLYELRAEE